MITLRDLIAFGAGIGFGTLICWVSIMLAYKAGTKNI